MKGIQNNFTLLSLPHLSTIMLTHPQHFFRSEKKKRTTKLPERAHSWPLFET